MVGQESCTLLGLLAESDHRLIEEPVLDSSVVEVGEVEGKPCRCDHLGGEQVFAILRLKREAVDSITIPDITRSQFQ